MFSIFKSKTGKLALLGFLFLSVFIALVALGERILRPKAEGGPTILSFAASPSPLPQEGDFDLILRANPNGLSFNAFEFHVAFDESKVVLRDPDSLGSNFERLYSSRLPLTQRVEGNKIFISSAKTGEPFSGTNDINLVKVKMRVKSGAAGQADFTWDDKTEVEAKPLEKQNGSFSIGESSLPTATPTPTGTSDGLPPTLTPTPTTPIGGPGDGSQASLYFTSARKNYAPGENLDLKLHLDTGGEQVNAVSF